jgi:hypothetical protein
MKIIDIPKTDKTPEVILDDDKFFFQIKGNCLPENVREFSGRVLGNLDEFMKSMSTKDFRSGKAPVFRINFRLGYFNSAAAKFLVDILLLSGNYAKEGSNIKVYWYFEEDDHDMLEAGEEISQMVDIPMEFITVVKE